MNFLRLIKTIITTATLACCTLTYAGTLTPADADIVEAINAKIAADATVSKLDVNVTSHDGIVTLTGKVKCKEEVKSLVEISESVDGVKTVETADLKIRRSKK